LILGIILLISLFFRTYKVIDRFGFAGDGDLFSWIVKDILVNQHLRLSGQQTSALGIFIGPLFYYLLTPFFLLFKMDPIGAIIPVTIIGIFTTLSYYFVFTKLFNNRVGLIVAFLHATLLSSVQFDRMVVPSTLTNIWTVWYFFAIISISRGNYQVLPLLGILIGLIWHIHIALIPALVAIPTAFLVSKKLPNKKNIILFLLTFSFTSLPLIVFEVRHNFQQVVSLLNNFSTTREGATGLYKFILVINMIVKNINTLLFAPQSFNFTDNIYFASIILISAVFLIGRKIITFKEIVPLYVWIVGVILFFSLSSSPISEYYFANIEIIFLFFTSLLLYLLFISSIQGRYLVLGVLAIIFIKNAYFFISQDYYHKGYQEKKAVVDYIIQDAANKNFPCFAINYITSPGENVGFRYFFFLKNVHLAVPGRGSPVYSIVIPEELAESKVKFNHIGIIPPEEIPPRELMAEACSGENTNLTEPMGGYMN
ncbi:glycosyltransferase family 39 protein, partial [Candidatus Daviesbacteria bacterium]|nr:glycosyltransferase family 39 protein [Candidatus Daviesbacteria bacterium]